MGLAGFEPVPVLARVPFIDYATALHAAFGVVLALYERRATGRGRLVDVSLMATGIGMMQALIAERAAVGVLRGREGNAGYWASPHNSYRAGDGAWIVVQTFGSAMFRRWAAVVGRPELADDPRLADDASRHANAGLIDQAMATWCAGRGRDEALAALRASRIPAGPVQSLDEAAADPQVVARGLLQELPVAGASRPVIHAPAPVRLGPRPQPLSAAAPSLGQHTAEVLADLGYSAAEIEALRAAGVT